MAGIFDQLVDANHSLNEVALRLRRAGLVHLVTAEDLTPEVVIALSDAGDRLELERAAALVKALHAPALALAPFDGGAFARQETKRRAIELSEARHG